MTKTAGDDVLKIVEYPGVCPVGEDTRRLARIAATVDAGRVLDMGTGTGYIGIHLAKCGCEVDSVDINGKALENARYNADENGVQINIFYSSLFDSTEGKYDLVIFNPPVNPDEGRMTRIVGSLIRRSEWLVNIALPIVNMFCGGKRYSLISEFIMNSKNHMNSGGYILTHLSDEEMGKVEVNIDGLKIDICESYREASTNYNIVKVQWK